jgi:hypothetical protein
MFFSFGYKDAKEQCLNVYCYGIDSVLALMAAISFCSVVQNERYSEQQD